MNRKAVLSGFQTISYCKTNENSAILKMWEHEFSPIGTNYHEEGT
jgi:hypothetical protein